MAFPLGEWIDAHPDCRHQLSSSGMRGTIPTPRPTPSEVRRADDQLLRTQLADDLRVDPRRLFLTTGASQANALSALFVGQRSGSGERRRCRVCFPEYPPLVDSARWAGFGITDESGPVELALLSQPRNPEGDLWDRSRFLEWVSGARRAVVDETFREFAGTRSLLESGARGLFATGTFTKFYAGDDLRVGWLVVPEDDVEPFTRFHGAVTNELAPYSVAAATKALANRERTRRQVREVLRGNGAALAQGLPLLRAPDGPVVFDRPETGEPGDHLQARALRASILVCSGSFFGDPSGVRLCLTRRSFPSDLRAYLAVRSTYRPRRRAR